MGKLDILNQTPMEIGKDAKERVGKMFLEKRTDGKYTNEELIKMYHLDEEFTKLLPEELIEEYKKRIKPENFDEFKQMILEPLLKKTRVYEKAKTDNTLRVNPEEALKEAVEVYANDLKRNPKKIEEAIEELVDGQEQKEKST